MQPETMKMTEPTLLAETLQLAFRIAIVWAGGFVFAVAVRAILPDKVGIPFAASSRIIPYSRIGFWTCLLAALTVSAMVVVRTMLVDHGLRAPR